MMPLETGIMVMDVRREQIDAIAAVAVAAVLAVMAAMMMCTG